MNFRAFAEDIGRNQWPVYGAEVYEDGRLVHQYGDTAQRHPIYSATKTITSLAVGMAADDGKLDVHRCVADYLPEEAVRHMSGEQVQAYRSITLERLLTMSVCGYPFRPSGASWLENALQTPIKDQRAFDYSNVSAYLVGVAASCAVEEDLYQYLNRRLFAPLGIENPPCGRCPDGYFYGASQMELSVNELSRIGLLLYNSGVYKGQRLVSEEYVKAATAVQQMNREGGYGYFIWSYRDGFSINGKWGQKCYVLPKQKQMVTFLSHMERGTGAVRESMERNILDGGNA